MPRARLPILENDDEFRMVSLSCGQRFGGPNQGWLSGISLDTLPLPQLGHFLVSAWSAAELPVESLLATAAPQPIAFLLLCVMTSPLRQAALPSILTSKEYRTNSALPLVFPDITPPAEPASSPVLFP